MLNNIIDKISSPWWWRILIFIRNAIRLPQKVALNCARSIYRVCPFPSDTNIRKIWIFREIRKSKLFDASFYLESNPDVAAEGMNPLYHYIAYGASERRNPNPQFDTSYYLENNPDVAAAGINPLYHYIMHGASEGRNPGPQFDTSYYLVSNPDVAAAGINPLYHYRKWGINEGRPATPEGPTVPATLEVRYAACPTRTPISFHTAASLARLLRQLMPQQEFLLSISHDDYLTVLGGVEILVGDEQRLCNSNQVGHLHLFPTNPRPTLARPDQPFFISINCNGQQVTECQADLALQAIEKLAQGESKVLSGITLHQLLGWNADWVCRLVTELGGGKALFWVHDFFALCPSYHLLRNDYEYCHAPPVKSNACQICIYGEERVNHLQTFHNLFNQLDLTLVTPSRYVEQVWIEKAAFRSAQRKMAPPCHIEWKSSINTQGIKSSQTPLNIGFLGRNCHHKGWTAYKRIVEKFVADPRYRFFHFAAMEDRSVPLTFIQVSVSSQNRNAMSEALLNHNIDVAFIWSVCPETFCFTLHEAMASGCYVLTNSNSGNVQATVLTNKCGAVLKDDEEALVWFDSGSIIESAREFRTKSARLGCLHSTPGSYQIILENL